MNQKHIMHSQISFGMASSIQRLGIGLFRWLPPSCCLYFAMQRSRGEAHVPEKSHTFHPKVSNALVLRISLFTHTAGHACMKCMGKIDCAHTHRVRVQPSFRHDSIHESVCMQQVFTSRQRTGNNWYSITSFLSFFCCVALGNFHKPFPSHLEGGARPHHLR